MKTAKINYYYAKYGRSGGSIEVHRWYKVFEFGRAVYAEKRYTVTNGNWNYKIGTINFVSNPDKLKRITKAIWLKQFQKWFTVFAVHSKLGCKLGRFNTIRKGLQIPCSRNQKLF